MTTLYGSVGKFGAAAPDPNVMRTYNVTRAMQGQPDGLSALGAQAWSMGAGLKGVMDMAGALLNPNAQMNYYMTGSPVGEVSDPGYSGGGGYGGGINQNTTYNQPYNHNETHITPPSFTPIQQSPLNPSNLGGNFQPSPMVQPNQAPPLFGMAEQFIAAGGQDPLPPGVASAIAAAGQPGPGVSVQQAGDGGQMPQGPLLQGNAPTMPLAVPQQAPMQQPPPQVVAQTPAVAGGAPAPLELQGTEQYSQTQALQGLPQADQQAQLEEARKWRELMEQLVKANQQGQQAPPPAPQQRKGDWLDAMSLMMSPKAATARYNQQAAYAKAKAELVQKQYEHKLDMDKEEYKADRQEQLEMKKLERQHQMNQSFTFAQRAEVLSKFMADEPYGPYRQSIVAQDPSFMPHLNAPQSAKAALDAKNAAADFAKKALDQGKDIATYDYQIQEIIAKSNKAVEDARGAQLDTAFKDRTYEWRAQQEEGQKEKLWQEIQLNAAQNPMKLQQMAMDSVAKLQDINVKDADQQRHAAADARSLLETMSKARGMLTRNHPAVPYMDAAIMDMMTALGKGESKQVKLPDGSVKNVVDVEGDKSAAGALTKQGIQRVLTGGTTFNAAQPQTHAPQQAAPASYRQAPGGGFLAPPPPEDIAPSIIPPGFNFPGMAADAFAKFGPNGLAQAPPPVQMQPPQGGAYNPAFGQPRIDTPPQAAPATPGQPPQAPNTAPQGAPLSVVQQSLKAGKWIGQQPPTLQEQLELLPHVLGGAIAKTAKEAPGIVANAMDAGAQKEWEGDKKKLLSPFVTPESRGLPKGSPLSDPELVSYFARNARTAEHFDDVVKSAGWTWNGGGGQPQPISKPGQVRQAWEANLGELLTREQQEQMKEADYQSRLKRAYQKGQGKVGFNIFPGMPPEKPVATVAGK